VDSKDPIRNVYALLLDQQKLFMLHTHMKLSILQQECTGSICLAYGLESCQCIPGPNDPLTKACELCCRLPGENQPCLCVILHYDITILFSNIFSTLLRINMLCYYELIILTMK